MQRPHLPVIVLLLLFAPAPLAAAGEDAPSAVRYALPSNLGNSLVYRGVTTCLDVDSRLPTLTYGRACVLAAPEADAITIRVDQDPGLAVTYEWAGMRADGTACGLGGWGLGAERVDWAPGCVYVAVAPATNGVTGTIRVS